MLEMLKCSNKDDAMTSIKVNYSSAREIVSKGNNLRFHSYKTAISFLPGQSKTVNMNLIIRSAHVACYVYMYNVYSTCWN